MAPLIAESAYHYIVTPEYETNCFVHTGSDPNYSPVNVTIFQNEIPGWTHPTSYPEMTERLCKNEGGTPYQMLDTQIDIDSFTIYKHTVYKVWNAFDLQNLTNFSIHFDPTFQKLTIHECKVFRNGTWLNKLDMNELRIIQPENDLEENLYSSQLYALIFLEDVREGDIIDYSYSLSGTFFPKFSLRIPLQHPIRWEKSNLRIIKPANRSFKTNIIPSEWSSFVKEDEHELVWELQPCPADNWEPDQPSEFPSCAELEISEFSNWNEVAAEIAAFYPSNEGFNEDPDVVRLIEKWKENSTNLEQQALQAIRFVQDEIRYLGIETGKGSFIPTDPLSTLKRRFGDCKGKSVLLKAFLDLLGIHADICLVHSELGAAAKNRLPSPLLFNHIIVRIELAGQITYVDATALYQGGGLNQIGCPFKTGLIVSKETQDLIDIPSMVVFPEIDCRTLFEIDHDRVEMNASIDFYANEANYYRALLKYKGLKALKPFSRYLEAGFGDFKLLSPVEISDDRTNNHITVSAHIALDQPWISFGKKSDKYLNYVPYFLSLYFTQTINTERKTPVQLPTSRIRESIAVKGGYILANTETIEDDAFVFHSSSDVDRVEFELFTRSDKLSPEDFESYQKKLDDSFDEINVLIKRR